MLYSLKALKIKRINLLKVIIILIIIVIAKFIIYIRLRVVSTLISLLSIKLSFYILN